MMQDEDQRLVARVLASRPPDVVRADFVARVNARIDATESAGWFALADFRSWTLRLAPIAGALVLVGLLWTPASPTTESPAAASPAQPSQAPAFTPASASDWQRDVTANALLEAAFDRMGDSGAR